jgi:hypothetical protein
MIEGLSHVGTDHVCNICSCDYTDDEGGVEGYLGILPVAFCPTCFASVCDMVEQLNGRDWEGLTMEELREIAPIWFERETSLKDFVEIVEAKLKEKNGYE